MSDHTIELTATEMAFKRTVQIRDEMQRATIAAALRTGKRIGVSVGQVKGAPKNEQGKPYNVELCAYRLNRKGEPTGAGKMTTLASGIGPLEVIHFLDNWNG